MTLDDIYMDDGGDFGDRATRLVFRFSGERRDEQWAQAVILGRFSPAREVAMILREAAYLIEKAEESDA